MENEKMIDRITALITKANAEGVTEHESEALMAKAYELMERYRVDDAMLAARVGMKFNPIHKMFLIEGTFANGRRYLAAEVVNGMNLTSVYTRRYNYDTGKIQKYVDVFGFETDLEIFQLLYTSLILQGSHEVVRITGYNAGDTRSLRAGFWYGFADKISWRLLDARQTVAKESTGTDLVLVGRRDELDKLKAEVYPSLKKSKAIRINARGYAHGEAAGARAQLHNTKSASVNARAAIGGLWLYGLPLILTSSTSWSRVSEASLIRLSTTST